MVQVPKPTGETVEPETVQTDVVDEEYETVKPDDALPPAAKSPAGFCFVVGAKVMVCEALLMVRVRTTELAASVFASPACEAVTSHVPALRTVRVLPEMLQIVLSEEANVTDSERFDEAESVTGETP
jgi:hypothetical protein